MRTSLIISSYGDDMRELARRMRAEFDEVVVIGEHAETEPMDGVKWIEMSASSALWLKETGARFATGEVLTFTHDAQFDPAQIPLGEGDVWVGERGVRIRRSIWAICPWTSVATSFWAEPMMRLWQEAGARVIA